MLSLKKIYDLIAGTSLQDAHHIPVSEGYGTGKVKKYTIAQLKTYIAAFVLAQISGITKGDKGDQGPRGFQGGAGEVGGKGEKGDNGERGYKGDKGEKGSDGIQGRTGEKGDKGAQGDKGEQGVQGEKGEKGEQGESRGTKLYYDESDLDILSGYLNIRLEDEIKVVGLGVSYAYVGDEPIPGAFFYRSNNTVSGFGGYIGASGLTIELTFI